MGMLALGLVVVASLSIASSSTTAQDSAALKNAVRDAIAIDQQMTALPAGFEVGHATAHARSELRSRIATDYRAHFTGAALTTRLNGLLAWADRVSKAPGDTHLLQFRMGQFQADQPMVSGDTATVSGSCVIFEKMGAENTGGKTMTWGGTITFAFTAQVVQRDGTWLVSDLAEQQTDYQHDPTLEQGMDGAPAPGATKSIPASYAPIVVNPANP
ncbi:MAG: hypothetical protein ACP5VP_04780 [Candidatus Limnocylindrales bacterium]